MTDTTPRAGAPLLAANQAQKNVTHNEALYQFDALLCARFLDRDLTTPPSSPADGDTYLVKATGTGAWTGQDGEIAYCADGGWRFYAPFMGIVAYVADENDLIVYNGSAWVDYGSLIALENIPMVGVNTTADATNKFSVQSNAALFNALRTGSGGSGDFRATLSKQTSGNTASFLFQDNFSGRAEIGLTGDDDFHFKVSSDGSTWHDAIQIAAATGVATAASVVLTTADINGGTLDGANVGATTPGTGKFTTLQATSGINATNIGATTAGTGAFTTLTASGAVTLSPASAAVAISPTGTGTVAISPAGALTINPTAASTINNTSVGVTTAAAGRFTTLTATGAVTLSPASVAVAISPTGTGTVAISPAGALTISPTAASTINNCSVGVTTAAAGVFTTLQGTTSLIIPTIANSTVATTMTSLGPTGSHATIQEWFPILNASGTTRYVPAY
jgi:hypothetical protein